jgi:hypothetical protein
MIFTDHRLRIEQVLKGDLDVETLTVSELGGYANGHGIAVMGAPRYDAGTRVLAFLRQRDDGSFFTAYMALGKYRFARAADGVEVLVRDRDGIEVDDHSAFALRPAEQFVEFVRGGAPAGVHHARSLDADHVPETNAAPSTYVLAGAGKPLRWNCPSACTKSWTVGNPQQGTVSTPEGVQDAMNAWSNDPDAWISLAIGGFNNQTVSDNDDVNDIVFNSNDNSGVCDAGLGCGIVYFNGPGFEHTFKGESFYDIVSSDVIVRPVNFTQNFFEAVLMHELGHGLGLKHAPSSGAIMSGTLPPNITPSLKAYDREAIAEVYGLGAPCSAPVVTNTSGGGTVQSGGTRTLSVTATGTTPFTYQWYKGPSGDTNTPVGTNSSQFTTPALTSNAVFWVKVSNACGTANSSTITIIVETPQCNAPTITLQPQSQNVAPGATATLNVTVNGTTPLTFQWYQGSVGDTSTPVGANNAQFTTPALQSTTSYWVRVSNSCGTVNSNRATITVSASCVPVSLVGPVPNATIPLGQGITLVVNAAGNAPYSYQWYEGASGDTSKPISGATNSSLALPPFTTAGARNYWVKVSNQCGTVNSPTIVITVACGGLATPVISTPATVHYSSSYSVSWTGDLSQTSFYELQEATNPEFTQNLKTYTVTGDDEQRIDAHLEITTDTRFYYRVRAISSCTQQSTNYSRTATTVVTRPQAQNSNEFSISVPHTATTPFTQDYLVPGFGANATNADTFAVSTDQPWLSVFPSSGALSAGGTTVRFTINPSALDIGSTTATVTVTRVNGTAARGPAVNAAATTLSLPFSVSKVTPVSPTPRGTDAPAGTLLIPAVAHADGIGTRFQSDVRIANASGSEISYALTFTPSGTNGTEVGKQTLLSIGGNENKGLDDVVKAWYGSGMLTEGGLGTLEIRPLNGANPKATFASSRTYAISANGTLGQFIPALPIEQFIRNIGEDALGKISLQQIANNDAIRTNLGFVEGSGAPVQFRVTLRDGANNILSQVTRSLPPFGHEQTSFAAVFGEVVVADARAEIEVISSTGKASAYASVLDNQTKDPMLVFPTQAAKVATQRVVVPGVAELDNGVSSNFHTDMRVFNAGATPLAVALNYYPQTGDATPRPAAVNITLAAGEVRAFDNVLPSLWSLSRTGGAVTVDAPSAAPLVVTARTYSRDANGGTYGQFIPGVTALDAVGNGERALEVLQLEQSEQYRTNLGLVEVTGSPVTVEIAGQTGSKATAVTHVVLNGNEFRQLGRIFTAMGFTNVYTGRISVKVIGGTGRVAAYGSVVDNRTVDPTYVPAQ